jgi:hypothetical protein
MGKKRVQVGDMLLMYGLYDLLHSASDAVKMLVELAFERHFLH